MSTENEEFLISQEKDGNKLKLFLKGEINVATSRDFEAFINDNLAGVSELEVDLEDIDFISSAGLRVFLTAQNIMDQQGKMVIRNVPENVMEVFEMTGFSDTLTIEREGTGE
jgi:anti-sigma B factor antagonist